MHERAGVLLSPNCQLAEYESMFIDREKTLHTQNPAGKTDGVSELG